MTLNDETLLMLNFVQEDGINFCWLKAQKTILKRVRSNSDNFVDFVNDIVKSLQEDFEPELTHLKITTTQPKLRKHIRAVISKAGFARFTV